MNKANSTFYVEICGILKFEAKILLQMCTGFKNQDWFNLYTYYLVGLKKLLLLVNILYKVRPQSGKYCIASVSQSWEVLSLT